MPTSVPRDRPPTRPASVAASFSSHRSERRASIAVARGSDWRNVSLKISSEIGPSYPVRIRWPMKRAEVECRPRPGRARWCRLHESTSMDRSGASASWTKKILSAGIVSIASGLWPFDRMWKLSRHTPDAIVVGETHDAGGRLVAVDESPPRERLVGDAHTEPLGEIAQLDAAGRPRAARRRCAPSRRCCTAAWSRCRDGS